MNQFIDVIEVNGEKYVREKSIAQNAPAQKLDGLPYCIVRTYSAGVFAGYLKNRNGQEVTLLNARRLWQWYGAASLSQLSQEGVKKPAECKFPCEVPEILLLQAIEICECTEQASLSIKGVPVWKIN